MLRFGRHRGLGVTIGAAAVEAAELGGRMRGWSHPIEPLAEGTTRWPTLVTALAELRAARGGRGGALTVVLLPPLAEVRPVTLPPLAADETRQVLARTPGRYFLGARELQVIGVAMPAAKAGADRAPRPVIAAAASARVLEAIYASAAEAGWTVQAIMPAETAWQTAALTIWPELRQGSHDVAVLRSGRTELLHLDAGVLTGVRRVGGVTTDGVAHGDASARDAIVPSTAGGGLAILGPAPVRESLMRAMAGGRGRAMTPPAEWSTLAESSELTAAAFAPRAQGLELVSEVTRQRRGAWRRRLTTSAAIAAVALIAVAAGFELWGARRELAEVRRERAALRPRTAGLVATRDSAMLVGQRLRELAAATSHNTPWSDVLTTVSGALPHQAYLTAFRATRDSLVLEGIAERAGDVFMAIKALPRFADVRSAAPVRQQLGDPAATTTLERFSVAARFAPTADTLGLALGATGR